MWVRCLPYTWSSLLLSLAMYIYVLLSTDPGVIFELYWLCPQTETTTPKGKKFKRDLNQVGPGSGFHMQGKTGVLIRVPSWEWGHSLMCGTNGVPRRQGGSKNMLWVFQSNWAFFFFFLSEICHPGPWQILRTWLVTTGPLLKEALPFIMLWK